MSTTDLRDHVYHGLKYFVPTHANSIIKWEIPPEKEMENFATCTVGRVHGNINYTKGRYICGMCIGAANFIHRKTVYFENGAMIRRINRNFLQEILVFLNHFN